MLKSDYTLFLKYKEGALDKNKSKTVCSVLSSVSKFITHFSYSVQTDTRVASC